MHQDAKQLSVMMRFAENERKRNEKLKHQELRNNNSQKRLLHNDKQTTVSYRANNKNLIKLHDN